MASILSVVSIFYALFWLSVIGIIIYLIIKRVKEKEEEDFGNRTN